MPNWWALSGAAAGIFSGKLGFLIPALTVILIFFPLFLCRMIGAGDIKMMAVLTGFLGFQTGAKALMAGFFIGGVCSFIKLLWRRELLQRLAYFQAYMNRLARTRQILPYYLPDRDGYGVTIPLTACIFAGACAVLFL